MKRHAALIPLSREHHDGLILARLLRQDAPPYPGLPDTPEAKLQYAREQWELHLLPHLEKEESLLAPFVKQHFKDQEANLERMFRDHAKLREGMLTLNVTIATQDAWGRLLEEHIRWEERIWFAELQEKAELLSQLHIG